MIPSNVDFLFSPNSNHKLMYSSHYFCLLHTAFGGIFTADNSFLSCCDPEIICNAPITHYFKNPYENDRIKKTFVKNLPNLSQHRVKY